MARELHWISRAFRPSLVPAMTPAQRRTKLRVCVVDDNHDSADSLAFLLQLAGHEVHTTYDAATTLTLARDVHPDCVISDINMPGMDGCELARRVKAEDPVVRLIAVSGRNDSAQTDRVREAGFDYQFTKPADPTAILEVLAMIQQVKELAEQTRAIAGETKQLLSDVTKEVKEVKVEVRELKQEVKELKQEMREARQNDSEQSVKGEDENTGGAAASR